MRLPRITTRWLMIWVLIVASLLALSRPLDEGWLLRIPHPACPSVGLVIAGVTWLLVRGHRRLALWCFGASAALANVWVAGLCIYFLGTGTFFWMVIVSFVTIPLALGSGAAWAQAVTHRDRMNRRSRLTAWTLVLAPVVLPITMILTFWPLRLAFLASRPALDRLADRVETGQDILRPGWAGTYLVVSASAEPMRIVDGTPEGRSGNILLFINTKPDGRSGSFVRVAPDSRDAYYHYQTYKFSDCEPMGGRWWYWSGE
jgi:hypothetical protein